MLTQDKKQFWHIHVIADIYNLKSERVNLLNKLTAQNSYIISHTYLK